MTNHTTFRYLGRLILLAPLAALPAFADSEFLAKPTWQPVSSDGAFAELSRYLETASLASDQQAAVRELWKADSTGSTGHNADVLDRLAACLAKVDDHVTVLVDFCSSVHKGGELPDFSWLADSQFAPLVRNNMRLYLVRWLAQNGYYDEALSWTDGMATGDVVAPEALLFYRAVAFQRLVKPDEADASLAQLLQQADKLPVRYQKLAGLMQEDLAGLEDDSLDHISRRMEDVRRRLAQGRSNQKVQTIENDVAESLKKLIKQAEDQAQQQQVQAAAGQSGGQQSPSPMQQSQLPRMRAPGDVDHRDIGSGSGWGNLPEKDREKAMQEVGREFPSHYREVIEEYFRRLAAEESSDQK